MRQTWTGNGHPPDSLKATFLHGTISEQMWTFSTRRTAMASLDPEVMMAFAAVRLVLSAGIWSVRRRP